MKRGVFFVFFILSIRLCGQIPVDRVFGIDELPGALKKNLRDSLIASGALEQDNLANYFRQHFSKYYFYDHQNVEKRLLQYENLYSNNENHKKRALDHYHKYADSTQWLLPFNYLNGEPVNAYALRHLARQHKMVDVILHYFSSGKDPKYIHYFTRQMQSLNAALATGQYEKIANGNGVYEAFRSGYRVLNWLWIHNMILNEPSYKDEDQLYTIATLLQHGQHLYERNSKFKPGNHQTRGMSALAMLAILLRDFEGTDLWYERAMQRLSEHLDKEVNQDGFQFERSIHYHMSDINNYYYVYQLAKLSDIQVDKAWEDKLRSLFTTLAKVAYPDKSAPVLQDDTEIPWAEKNDIADIMTLGYLLFEDPEFGYFASNKVDDRIYWSLNHSKIELLQNIQKKRPGYGSLSFPDTHYYISREGWNEGDKMMIISAGVDNEKPDHQHGDILGIQAYANGQVILPNYQVRYSLNDLELFKNSMVKNVALVDGQLQGKKWTSNKGGSGFGKFKKLPQPKVINWQITNRFDLFAGSHDGFENIGVQYSRQVLYLKDDLWIVKDNFESDAIHQYKQIWQGHYTYENAPNLIRATYPDASGSDILQLNPVDSVISDGARGKNWTIVTKKDEENFNFITAIYPYKGYNNRIDEHAKEVKIGDWHINNSKWKVIGDHPVTIENGKDYYFFNVTTIDKGDIGISSSSITDLFINHVNDRLLIYAIGTKKNSISIRSTKISGIKTFELNPGENMIIDLSK